MDESMKDILTSCHSPTHRLRCSHSRDSPTHRLRCS